MKHLKQVIIVILFFMSTSSYAQFLTDVAPLDESLEVTSQCDDQKSQILIQDNQMELLLPIGEIRRDQIVELPGKTLLNTETRVAVLKEIIQDGSQYDEIAMCLDLDLATDETKQKGGSTCSNNICVCWGSHCDLFAAACDLVGGELLEVEDDPFYGSHKTCILPD